MGNSHASRKGPAIQESISNQTENLRIVVDAVWEWKSNPDPWATDELPQWTKYSTEQMQAIEKAFQEKKETVEIGDYVINLKSLLQMHKEQNWRARPVRRTEMSQRATRFSSELITPRTFGRVTYTGDPTIVEKWVNKRKFNFKIDKQGYNITDEEDMPQLREVVALAVKGILEEGQKENLGSFTENLAKRLEDSISQNPRSIFRECIYVYTDENKPGASSLYTVVNKALREVDYSKVEALGPYCYLLNFALKGLSEKNAEFFYTGKVYRGLGLEENMLEMYKAAWKRGLQISFHSFISTSKRKEVATAFSLFRKNQRKVLLIIETLGGAYVEALTSHHGEEEVLLPASRGFQITDIDERNPDMPIISLKMVNTKLDSLHFEDDFSYGILLSHSSFTELPPSLSQWAKEKKVDFEISEDGKNITPENESLQLKEFVELAAEGIRKFGETQDVEDIKTGRKMADMLIYTMKNEPADIFRTIIKLYSMNSFLYFHANKILRSESSEELNDLGPYCYLLNAYLIAINKILSESSKSNKPKFVTLYRGILCKPVQMNIFKELYAKNLHFAFSAFTSTTTERYIAEHFRKFNGNQSVLYVISVPESMVSAFDISEVSEDQGLKEVLLPPNISFKITAIDEKAGEIKLEFIDYMI